jgi:hypothetical protein
MTNKNKENGATTIYLYLDDDDDGDVYLDKNYNERM